MQAHEALIVQGGPDWLQPKGVGVVCVRPEGMPANSFVHFYFGKMCVCSTALNLSPLTPCYRYTPSKWFEQHRMSL